MATQQWVGGAEAVAQVTDWVFGGTWEADDVITVTIGTHQVSLAAGSTTTATVASNVQAALDACTLTEFTEITWTVNSSTVTGTAVTAGVPFTATFATTESGGGSADAQTIDSAASSTGTDSTACTGPNHADDAENWSGGALPGNSDTVIFADSDVDCLYGLDGLSSVTGVTLKVFQSFTGDVGLPVYNDTNGYYEYRQRYLQFTGATLVEIGLGEGSGSSRLMFDFQATAATINAYNSGPPASGEEVAVFLKGTHTSNVATINKGYVGIAAYPGEASALATLAVGYRDNVAGDAFVICGSGVTALTTINQSGGVCRTETNSTTLNMTDGEHIRLGTSTLTTANIDGGACRYRSSGTLTNANVGSNGNMDFRQDQRSRTVTNISLYENSEWHDPFGTANATNGYDFVRCTPEDVTFDVVPNRTWTPSTI